MAIAHAAQSDLLPLDDVLMRLLVRLGISREEALMHLNLAPLNTRRDIALLGIIHRAACRKGPTQFHIFFMRAEAFYGHSRLLYDPCVGRPQMYMKRSIFGLVRFYNALPEDIIQVTDIAAFQSQLQELVRKAIRSNMPIWHLLFRD